MNNLLNQEFIGFVHRGGAEETTENTIPAFQYALDLGFRFIETDVQATKDGKIVIFHDSDLSRMSSRKERIKDLNFDEISKIDLNGGGKIPLLEEALITFPEAFFNIDVKTNDAVKGTADIILEHANPDNICIASFSTKRITELRNLLGKDFISSSSQYEVTLLLMGMWMNALPKILHVYWPDFEEDWNQAWIRQERIKCVQVPPSQWGIPIVTPRFIKNMHECDKKVHVWTIDDKEEMQRLYDLGVDGIMTDKPSVLKEFLESKNLF